MKGQKRFFTKGFLKGQVNPETEDRIFRQLAREFDIPKTTVRKAIYACFEYVFKDLRRYSYDRHVSSFRNYVFYGFMVVKPKLYWFKRYHEQLYYRHRRGEADWWGQWLPHMREIFKWRVKQMRFDRGEYYPDEAEAFEQYWAYREQEAIEQDDIELEDDNVELPPEGGFL